MNNQRPNQVIIDEETEETMSDGYLKRMHEWSTLTWDIKSYLDKVLEEYGYGSQEAGKGPKK